MVSVAKTTSAPLRPFGAPPQLRRGGNAAILTAALLWAGAAAAASPEAPAGALSCSGCHPAGKGVDTPVLSLAGRAPADLAAAMRDFRNGARAPTVMGRIAKGFTDPEIDALAAWFGAQKD
ncbi:cytochrome C [Reyranella sp. CPCC 100927]|uniref:c-type cytochrome n=1 Tax=Reyranella sp. CPCC 100927 TaxID=2599616 RepID=UPI0021061238|nr:cytochrome C [Reyranella sp. CPCC 100927]